MRKLAVKVEKQLKSRKAYPSTSAKPTVPLKPFNSYKIDAPPGEDKDKGKGKEVVKKAPNGKKKCFKCYEYGHLKADCPNRRVLTIREIEGLDQMEVEEGQEES